MANDLFRTVTPLNVLDAEQQALEFKHPSQFEVTDVSGRQVLLSNAEAATIMYVRQNDGEVWSTAEQCERLTKHQRYERLARFGLLIAKQHNTPDCLILYTCPRDIAEQIYRVRGF